MSTSSRTLLRHFARILSQSFLLDSGKELWELNRESKQLSLSKYQKAVTGIYLVLHDYSRGIFPPTFEDQQKVYDSEVSYSIQWPGLSVEKSFEVAQMKPFWFNQAGSQYLADFIDVMKFLEKLNITPPMKLLELGCGTGWMAEFLATMGFEVIGTTLSPHDIAAAHRRVESLSVKGFDKKLSFQQAPMEDLEENLGAIQLESFDCIYVYEALHHAYSWQKTIEECFRYLKPGGWLLICNEPNLVHTMVSYRVSILTDTHEIGFNRQKLISHMQKGGFSSPKILKNHFAFGVKPLWIAAQK